jgi:hypothetical protein
VDDVKAEPGTAFRPPCGEEGIENEPLVLLRNSASVVGEGNFDKVGPYKRGLEQHIADRSIGKTDNGIEDQVGQHLSQSAWVAVEGDISGYVEGQRMARLRQAGHYAGDDLLRYSSEVEAAAICKTAIDGNLLRLE